VTVEYVSGLDDLFYDVTLTDAGTGAAITTGAVSMQLVTAGTVTPLGATASCALTHVAAGRWTGTHDAADVAAAIAGVANGQLFDRVLVVTGLGVRKRATCRRVVVVDESE
jgi:hypothetical protein